MALKKVDLERCIRRNGDIRAWFPDDSSIVFRLDGVTDDTLTGSSQNFGTATFKISRVQPDRVQHRRVVLDGFVETSPNIAGAMKL